MRAIPLILLAFFGILCVHAYIEDNTETTSEEMMDHELEGLKHHLHGYGEFIDRQFAAIRETANTPGFMAARMDKLLWTLDGSRSWADLDLEKAYRTWTTLGVAIMENRADAMNAEGYYGWFWFELPPYRGQMHKYKLQKARHGSLTNWTITGWHHIRDSDVPHFPKLNQTVGCNMHCVMDYIFQKTDDLPEIPS